MAGRHQGNPRSDPQAGSSLAPSRPERLLGSSSRSGSPDLNSGGSRGASCPPRGRPSALSLKESSAPGNSSRIAVPGAGTREVVAVSSRPKPVPATGALRGQGARRAPCGNVPPNGKPPRPVSECRMPLAEAPLRKALSTCPTAAVGTGSRRAGRCRRHGPACATRAPHFLPLGSRKVYSPVGSAAPLQHGVPGRQRTEAQGQPWPIGARQDKAGQSDRSLPRAAHTPSPPRLSAERARWGRASPALSKPPGVMSCAEQVHQENGDRGGSGTRARGLG